MKTIITQNLTNLDLLELKDKKYNLSDLDMTKYITAYDHIRDSLNCDKYKFTEGITSNSYFSNNYFILKIK